MRKIKLFSIVFATMVLMFSFTIQPTFAKQKFKDVPSSYWAFNDIEWAASKGLIKGYPDGSFKTDNTLTEAQFAAVFSRYFNPSIESQPSTSDWSKKYYDYLSQYGITLPGHSNSSLKNKPIKRKELAKALSTSQGISGDLNKTIDWMYTNGLTTGKGKYTDKYKDFGSDDYLKRSQVSAFFKRMDNKGFSTMKVKASTQPFVLKSPVVGNDFYNKLESLVKSKGFDVTVNPQDDAFGQMRKNDEVNFLALRIDFFATKDTLNSVVFIQDNKESYEALIDVMEAYGFKVDDKESLVTKLYNYGKVKGDTTDNFKLNGWEITLQKLPGYQSERVNVVAKPM